MNFLTCILNVKVCQVLSLVKGIWRSQPLFHRQFHLDFLKSGKVKFFLWHHWVQNKYVRLYFLLIRYNVKIDVKFRTWSQHNSGILVFFWRQTLEKYFRDVINLSEQLGKQLWVIIQRTLMSVRREPTLIVTALRIIEREER